MCTIVALFTPSWIVSHLRNATPYRYFVRSIKLIILPLFFAASFYALAIVFGSHFAFSLGDSFGVVCPTSQNIADKPDDEKPDQGLRPVPARWSHPVTRAGQLVPTGASSHVLKVLRVASYGGVRPRNAILLSAIAITAFQSARHPARRRRQAARQRGRRRASPFVPRPVRFALTRWISP